MTSVSAVIPAFNEQEAIAKTVSAVRTALALLFDDYEIIIVDDGSTDRTREIGFELGRINSSIRVVGHDSNAGYGAALATGFAAATREYIFITDGDGQFDPMELREFLPLATPYALVVGHRSPRVDPRIRLLYGWGWNQIVRLLFGSIAHDVDCAFKLIPRRLLELVTIESRGHTFSPELLIRARQAGFQIIERNVRHYPRLLGEAKGARVSAIVVALFELAKLRVTLGRSMGAQTSFPGP